MRDPETLTRISAYPCSTVPKASVDLKAYIEYSDCRAADWVSQ